MCMQFAIYGGEKQLFRLKHTLIIGTSTRFVRQKAESFYDHVTFQANWSFQLRVSNLSNAISLFEIRRGSRVSFKSRVDSDVPD